MFFVRGVSWKTLATPRWGDKRVGLWVLAIIRSTVSLYMWASLVPYLLYYTDFWWDYTTHTVWMLEVLFMTSMAVVSGVGLYAPLPSKPSVGASIFNELSGYLLYFAWLVVIVYWSLLYEDPNVSPAVLYWYSNATLHAFNAVIMTFEWLVVRHEFYWLDVLLDMMFTLLQFLILTVTYWATGFFPYPFVPDLPGFSNPGALIGWLLLSVVIFPVVGRLVLWAWSSLTSLCLHNPAPVSEQNFHDGLSYAMASV